MVGKLVAGDVLSRFPLPEDLRAPGTGVLAEAPLVSKPQLLALRVGTLWRFLKSQNLAYGAMCLYLLVEYVRPQQLVPLIRGVALGQVALGTALVAHVASGRWFRARGPASWLLVVFTLVIFVSSLTAYSSSASLGQWWLWFSWLVIYFLIVNIIDNEPRLVFFALLWLLFHYYMAQGGAKQFVLRGFTFAKWGVVGAPGWFQNSGEFGVAMCMFLPVSWHFYLAGKPYLTKWRKLFVLGMPVSAVLGIIGSSSRGAVLGLAAIGAWSLLRSKYRLRTTIGVAVVSVAVWFILPQQQKARFSAIGQDSTSIRRMTYWQRGLQMAREHPVFGVGYANWVPYYTEHYVDPAARVTATMGYVQVPHNIFVQCMAELGYVGLGVFLLMILATFAINHRTRKMTRAGRAPPEDFLRHMAYGLDGALIGYLASGFFVTVLYYPFFWVNLAFTAALHTVATREWGRQAPASLARQRVGRASF